MTADESGALGGGSEVIGCVGVALMPVSVVTGRQGLATARWAVASPQIAVAAARVAERGNASVFLGDDEVKGLSRAIHGDRASTAALASQVVR
jgi:hypothetical protein